jgi:hypothetical protein
VQRCVEGGWLTWQDCLTGQVCRITAGAAACEGEGGGGMDMDVGEATDTDLSGGTDTGDMVDTCPAPTLALCQDIEWLDTTECGQAMLAAMRADPDAPCNALLAEAALANTRDIAEETVADPDGGVDLARVVPNPDKGLDEINMDQTQTEV